MLGDDGWGPAPSSAHLPTKRSLTLLWWRQQMRPVTCPQGPEGGAGFEYSEVCQFGAARLLSLIHAAHVL